MKNLIAIILTAVMLAACGGGPPETAEEAANHVGCEIDTLEEEYNPFLPELTAIVECTNGLNLAWFDSPAGVDKMLSLLETWGASETVHRKGDRYLYIDPIN